MEDKKRESRLPARPTEAAIMVTDNTNQVINPSIDNTTFNLKSGQQRNYTGRKHRPDRHNINCDVLTRVYVCSLVRKAVDGVADRENHDLLQI